VRVRLPRINCSDTSCQDPKQFDKNKWVTEQELEDV
jgi:hypothetical protein